MDDTNHQKRMGLGGARSASESFETDCRSKRRREDRGKSRMAVVEEESQSGESNNGRYLELESMIQ